MDFLIRTEGFKSPFSPYPSPSPWIPVKSIQENEKQMPAEVLKHKWNVWCFAYLYLSKTEASELVLWRERDLKDFLLCNYQECFHSFIVLENNNIIFNF